MDNKKKQNKIITKNNKIKGDSGHEVKNKIHNSRNQPLGQIKDSTTFKKNLSDNKNFASKELLTNKLTIFNQKSSEIISQTPSERKSVKNQKESN